MNLKEFNKQEVENYVAYVTKLRNEKKSGAYKNQWARKWTDEKFERLFRKVQAEGFAIDGNHITINQNGVSFDYVAYKNKMLAIYPESLIDLQLVYEGDEYAFKKESGKVMYTHSIANPFGGKEADIIGGYCVIKNKRGEFLSTLSRDDIEKHRQVAKTDYIWKQWYKEMALKTVIKKAVKIHFDDIYQGIEDLDNDQYDLEKAEKEVLLAGTNQYVKVVERAKEKGMTLEEIKEYYKIDTATEKLLKKELA